QSDQPGVAIFDAQEQQPESYGQEGDWKQPHDASANVLSDPGLPARLAARPKRRVKNDRISIPLTQHRQLNSIARFMLGPNARDRVRTLQWSSIDCNDAISRLQSGALSRAAGHDTLHKLGPLSGEVLVVKAQFDRDPAAAEKDPHRRVKDTGSGKKHRQRDQQRPWRGRKQGHKPEVKVPALPFHEQEHQVDHDDAGLFGGLPNGKPDKWTHGGARPGGGKPKGSKLPSTLRKEEAREFVRQYLTARLGEYLDAMSDNVIGIRHLMMRDPKTGKFE